MERLSDPDVRRSRTAALASLVALSIASAATVAAEPPVFTGLLEPYIERHEVVGAVTAVVSKEKVLSIEALGSADIGSGKPMQTDSLFWIASMGKPIAAAALMMLVDEGKVHVNDAVEQYLPTFAPRIMAMTVDGAHVRLRRPEHPITVLNLLSHTSGVPYRSSLETPTLDQFPLAIAVQSYALEPLMFEPGSDFSYSDAGLNTAMRIVEVVSGMRYEEFLQRRVFDPLRMQDTPFWPTEAPLRRLAQTYKIAGAGGGPLEETILEIYF